MVYICLGWCLGFSSVAMVKSSDKGNFREEGSILSHSSRAQSIMTRKQRQQEIKVTRHIALD